MATSYITYLTRVLDGEDSPGGFRAELVPSSRKINAERRANMKNNGLVDNLQVSENSPLFSHPKQYVLLRLVGLCDEDAQKWRTDSIFSKGAECILHRNITMLHGRAICALTTPTPPPPPLPVYTMCILARRLIHFVEEQKSIWFL